MDKKAEANIAQLAGDMHIVTWPVRVALHVIVIGLILLSLPFVLGGWLVYHAVTGTPVDFGDQRGWAWVISHLLIIAYPIVSMFIYFTATAVVKRTSTLASWGWQVVGLIEGILLWYPIMWLRCQGGWSTASILFLYTVISAIPIGVAFSLRSKHSLVKFLIFCGCLALMTAVALRGGVKESCNSLSVSAACQTPEALNKIERSYSPVWRSVKPGVQTRSWDTWESKYECQGYYTAISHELGGPKNAAGWWESGGLFGTKITWKKGHETMSLSCPPPVDGRWTTIKTEYHDDVIDEEALNAIVEKERDMYCSALFHIPQNVKRPHAAAVARM